MSSCFVVGCQNWYCTQLLNKQANDNCWPDEKCFLLEYDSMDGSCVCLCSSPASFEQVKRGVGRETGEVVVMPTKVWHHTGTAVVMAAERGTNEPEVLRSWRGSDATEGSSGEGPAGNKRAEARKVMIGLHLPYSTLVYSQICYSSDS